MASDFQVNPIDGTSTRASSWQRAFQPRNRRLVAEPGPGIKQDALPISRLQEPIEGSAVQVPLRGAPQAAEEEAR